MEKRWDHQGYTMLIHAATMLPRWYTMVNPWWYTMVEKRGSDNGNGIDRIGTVAYQGLRETRGQVIATARRSSWMMGEYLWTQPTRAVPRSQRATLQGWG